MTVQTAPPGSGDADRIIDEPLSEALSRRYLAYALSVITDRALPDVRDGLKPVQRRVLYAMREMRLNPENAARKCAKVVGEVMGGYHPHGDQSIYDTLVRMAQHFAQRYPLVDGQGNFGNIDGDNAAAMRYTEAKLTVAATLLLEGIEEDAVDFKPTYDGSDDEPVVLPAGFPNLLANGSTGIAVGMATSIPPHNAGELIDACLLLLDQPDASTEALMAHVQGPDFPTGGVIVEPRGNLAEVYATGRGGVRVRARWEKEDLGKGTYQIVVTEVPYQVKKADLVEQLAELIEAKRVPLLGDVRDESAEDVRLILEPKSRNVEPEVLMESLFKLSDLETRFSVNLNVLDARGTPGVMSLKQALTAFLDHRRDVLVRRARHRLEKIEARLHILDGLLVAYLNLDEVIRIVRYEEHPKAKLVETFTLSELQADAILNTRLRQLARLEEMEIRREHAELSEERDGIIKMLASDKAQWKLVATGLKDVKSKLGKLNDRRSTFAVAPQIDTEAALEAMIVREPITIILSERGWIRAAKGRVEDPSELKFKEGDKLAFLVPAETTDKLLIFASDGRFFTLGCDKLPGARGHGEPLRLMIDLDDRVAILDVFPHKAGTKRLLASKQGYGFILPEEEAIAFRRAGKQVLNAGDPTKKGEGAAVCLKLADADQLAVMGDNGKLLVFATSELPEMPRGKGVKLQSYREGGLRDAAAFKSAEGMTTVDASGRTRAWPEWQEWAGRRASAGKLAPKGFPANKRFRAALMAPAAPKAAPVELPRAPSVSFEKLWTDVVAWVQAHGTQIIVALLAGLVLYLVLGLATRLVSRLKEKPGGPVGFRALIGRAAAKTTHLFMILAAARLVVGYAHPPRELADTVGFLFTISAVFQAAVWIREIVLGLIERRTSQEGHSETLANATGIIRLLVTVVIFAIAVIVVLDNLGVNVTALVAGLGIGGIAIGLAAQGIFSDLFAALSIIFDKPFKVGETITYDTSTATVERIGLKSTRLRAVTGERKIVSNANLLQKEITSYQTLDHRRLKFLLSVIYQTDPALAARIPDILREIVEAAGGTFVRAGFINFAASSLDFEVEYDVFLEDWDKIYAIRHRIGLDILRRFHAEGLSFAYPTQTSFTAAPDGRLILPYHDPDAPG